MLKVEGLVRRIADFELRASFEVGARERLALLGRSGSGKTSLLRALAGLDPPEAGRLTLDGRDLGGVPVERRAAGFVFQEGALFPTMSVVENVAFGLEMQGVARAERERRAAEMLEAVGLGALIRASVEKLSGGERSRVALARAFAARPRYLLLDEPFSALDAATRAQVRALVVWLHDAHPAPLLLVTHDREDVAQVASRTIELAERGRVREFVSAKADI